MIWLDKDGDSLEIKEVFGFGYRTLLVRVTQEGDEEQMNLNEAQAREVVYFLRGWLESDE